MKKILTITVICMLTISFLAIGNTRADAMNNESAALMTAGIVLLGIPVMHAIAHEGRYPGRSYAYAAPPPRYEERTTIVYVEPRHERRHKHWRGAYDRGYRNEWKRLERRRGRHDARHDFRRY